MFRVTGFPHEPLARFRLLALWMAETLMAIHVAMYVAGGGSPPADYVTAISSIALGGWWWYGYRRGSFPRGSWIVEGILVTIAAAWSPLPLRAIGVFYMGIQFRALYAPQRNLLALPITYVAARIISFGIGPSAMSLGGSIGTWWVQIVGLAVISIVLQLFADASRKHAEIESALEKSDERYRLVAGATRDAIYDWDVATGVIHWTESVEHVFGFAPSEIRPELSWWLDRVHPADLETLRSTVSTALARPESTVGSVEYRVRRADESYAYVTGSMLVQRQADGKAYRVVGSIRDVTSERQLEDQLRQSQKMEAIGQLAGGVAHDFNNLLTVIGGHVYMLEQSIPRSEVVARHLGGITRATQRAAVLTRQLLAFSRRQMLTPSVLALNDVVDDVIEMIRPLIGEHIRVDTRLDPELPAVFADAGQLGQVIVNLALNARDAMPRGGTLTIETDTTTIGARTSNPAPSQLPPGRYVRLVVRDSGEGMDAETLARAFEPFFTTKPKGAGSGLGLSTVYGIVKQSFGDITAESTLGAGSAFTILLPVTERKNEPLPERREITGVIGGGAPERHSLLLVEDDAGVREFAEDVLRRAGYDVFPARNGVDALAQIDARNLSVDVVVTDVVMPEMGGRDLVEHLRRWRPDLPVLYISGYTDDPRMLGSLYDTDVRLLAKPFTASALEDAVRSVTAHLPEREGKAQTAR